MTRQSAFWLSISFLLCLRGEPSVVSSQYQTGRQRDGRAVTELSHLDSDFENGILDPWIEESLTSGVQWKIENRISPWDLNNKAPPQQNNGKSYLRVDRGTNFKFGVAVLRSPAFSLPSSESDLSFSFWIRSKWPQYTNLELYLAENGNERLMLSLYNYSVVTNQAWETQSISLIGSSSSNTFSLVFYAYCGTDPEDAVAIDDIRFTSNQFTEMQTTPSVETTMDTQSTATNPESTAMTTTILAASTTPSEQTTTTTTSTSTVTTVTTEVPTTTISASFTCPDTSEKKYPDPENPCNGKYYQCSEGIATLTDCQANLIFNSNAQLCIPCSLVLACAAECDE